MATMIPKDINEFKTEGEKRFYRFLEAVAKPDQKYTIWYLPDIEGREPDFILFCDEVGLVIFEVKDWDLNQIQEATPRSFILMMGHEKRSLKNPLLQAREYFESLLARIQHDGRLLSKDAVYFGKPKVPIDYGVVFPNINKYAYRERGLDQVISPDKVFFWDDLHLASDICNDATGGCFQKALVQMFPPKFPFRLGGSDYSHLKQLLFPVVRIDAAERGTCAFLDPTQRIEVLDDSQEALARNCNSGCHLIKGPSGSGKTLLLVHKAAFLKHYRPEIQKILFLCFNITLVNTIKRLLFGKGVGLGPGGVEVYHFFELCSRILGETLQYEKEGADYYQLVEEETLAKLRESPQQFDSILVDEGQDFTQGMIEIVYSLLDPDMQNLTVAVDEDQNIYQREPLWQAQLPERLRVDEISGMYRNTAEIRRFALSFLRGKAPGKLKVSSVYCETHGPKPELRQFKDLDRVLAFVADRIKMLHDQGEYPLSEFAILYARRSFAQAGALSGPELVMATLEARGLISQWVSEDYRAKCAYDITTDKVSVSTIHSAKGLDYACVFLLGTDDLSSSGWSEEQIRRLVYVGITRARHRLYIPFVQRSATISELTYSLRAL